MRFDIFIRTLIWLIFIALWIFLNKPTATVLLPSLLGWVSWVGVSLIAGGVSLYIWSARLLAIAAPISSPKPLKLLTSGPYSYVRNPLYLGIAFILAGVSVLYGAWQTNNLIAGAIVLLCAHFRVVFYEEPETRKQLGAAYDEYCRAVPRWFPRWRPWVR